MEFKKVCPICATGHNKRGPFCSKICSNKARVVTPKTRRKMSASQKKRMATEEAKTKNWSFLERGKLKHVAITTKANPDEFEFNPENLYLPPITDETPDGAFSDGKDLWFTAD